MDARICWLSVDPVRRKLDFYPRAIAARVEKAFRERGAWSEGTLNSSITLSTEHPSSDPGGVAACVLGSDFFNATVHFHPSGRHVLLPRLDSTAVVFALTS